MKDHNFEHKANLYTSIDIFNKCPICNKKLTYFYTIQKLYCVDHGAMV